MIPGVEQVYIYDSPTRVTILTAGQELDGVVDRGIGDDPMKQVGQHLSLRIAFGSETVSALPVELCITGDHVLDPSCKWNGCLPT